MAWKHSHNLGWFWVHAPNIAHVRPWCKNGVQKPNPKRKEIELSFLQHSISLEKTRKLFKKKSKSNEKLPSYVHLKSRAKVAAGPFWAENMEFWPYFLKYGYHICFAHHLH